MSILSSAQTPRKRASKLDDGCLRLTRLAHELGADAQLPRVADLKELLGISGATLDRVLGRLEEQDVIYRVQGSGIFVSRSVQPLISVICEPGLFRSNEDSPFWNLLLGSAQRRANAHNEAFEMHFAQPGAAPKSPLQRGLMREFEEHRISGVIGIALEESATDWIEARNVPFVGLFGPGQHVVHTDIGQLLCEGVGELMRAGCGRLGVWHPMQMHRPYGGTSRKEYVSAVVEALDELSLPIEDERVLDCAALLPEERATEHPTYTEQGRVLVQHVFGGPRARWPDGLILTDDLMARGALSEMERLEVRPGRDVEIVALANRGSSVLQGFERRITTIEFDPQEIVETVFGTLEQLMKGEGAPALQRVKPRQLRRRVTQTHDEEQFLVATERTRSPHSAALCI